MSRSLMALGLTILLVSVGAVAFADSHEEATVYVWINAMKAKPGQGDALIANLIENDGKQFDPLVESGKALEWGIAMPVVHDGDDPVSHYEWVSFVGWEGVDKFMESFMAMRQATSPEDLKAMGEQWSALVEPGSHADVINRSVHIGKSDLSRPGYIHLGYWTAHADNMDGAMKLYKEYAAPVYDKLLADGAIQNYGLHMPAVHRSHGWTHMSWYSTQNLAARDAVTSAFDAKDAAMSEDEMKALMDKANKAYKPGHIDQILLVVHHKMASGGAEE